MHSAKEQQKGCPFGFHLLVDKEKSKISGEINIEEVSPRKSRTFNNLDLDHGESPHLVEAAQAAFANFSSQLSDEGK